MRVVMTIEIDPSALHDPGGKTKLRLAADVMATDGFSPCGRYRPKLTREWTPQGATARSVLFLGKNPSVASKLISDPTVHREEGHARRWGFTRYLKGNMLDWRATSPDDLPHDPKMARSPENLPAILEMAREAEFVVLAYGRLHQRYAFVVDETMAALRGLDKPLFCFAKNADGSAKHPLYLRNDAPLIPF